MTRPPGLRTWIEIDKKAIAWNYRIFRSLISKETKLLAVVKSNAYGHSLIDFGKIIEKIGADWLGVDSAIEAISLRDSGVKKPILVLGYTLPEMIKEMVEKNISFTISSFDQLKELNNVKTRVPKKIHIKVDTGMNRQGFLEKDIPILTSGLLNLKTPKEDKFPTGQASKLIVEGLFTHFAMAKNPSFSQFTKKQLDIFQKWTDAFNKAGFKPIVHASATGGAILYPESHFDMVRIGIGLYGLWPSKETEAFIGDKIKLEPVLSWKTIVSEVKNLPLGGKIGYDLTEILPPRSKIAICPIGYWHGFPRALSSVGKVLIHGKEARVIGRVSMDMIVVDVTKIPRVIIEDEVVLVGRQGKKEITAEKLADIIDISPYEFLTRINPLIKRFYI